GRDHRAGSGGWRPGVACGGLLCGKRRCNNAAPHRGGYESRTTPRLLAAAQPPPGEPFSPNPPPPPPADLYKGNASIQGRTSIDSGLLMKVAERARDPHIMRTVLALSVAFNLFSVYPLIGQNPSPRCSDDHGGRSKITRRDTSPMARDGLQSSP